MESPTQRSRGETPRPKGFNFDAFYAEIDRLVPPTERAPSASTEPSSSSGESSAAGLADEIGLSARRASSVPNLSRAVFGGLGPHI